MSVVRLIVLSMLFVSVSFTQPVQTAVDPLVLIERNVQFVEADYRRDGKCGTPLVIRAIMNRPELSISGREELGSLLQRPGTQTSRLSPSGRFRIHYDTSGVHQPAMIAGVPAARVPASHETYVDSVAAIFDRCWTAEVDELGFEAPPSDNGQGGGNEYDVYIQALGPGTFGFTSWQPEDSLETGARQRYPTYITIDVDFLGERTPGLDGLRVTAAHEFHHAIQVGGYGVWLNILYSDFFFYELTSVWMEEVLYDDINDYYFDLPGFFQSFKDPLNRSLRFVTNSPSGYERSVWALYLSQRFGKDVLRVIWSEMKNRPALQAMDEVLRGRGSSLAAAFAEFGHWNLFTGFRANPAVYFEEGMNFPPMRMNATTTFTGSMSTISASAYPFSLQYFRFDIPGDTIFAVVTHSNFAEAHAVSPSPKGLELTLTSRPQGSGAVQHLRNGLSMSFFSATNSDWRTIYLGGGSISDLRDQAPIAPNPLVIDHSTLLTLPADDGEAGTAFVYLISSSLDLAFQGAYPIIIMAGRSLVNVPVGDLRNKVSSGTYFVVMKTAEKEHSWKLLIVR